MIPEELRPTNPTQTVDIKLVDKRDTLGYGGAGNRACAEKSEVNEDGPYLFTSALIGDAEVPTLVESEPVTTLQVLSKYNIINLLWLNLSLIMDY